MKKKLYLILLSVPLFSHAQTINVQKAHQNIIFYLKKRLNDPNSFSVASWGKPEKIYEDFETSYEGTGMQTMIDTVYSAKNKIHDLKLNLDLYYKGDSASKDSLSRRCARGIDRCDFLIDSLKKVKEQKRLLFK